MGSDAIQQVIQIKGLSQKLFSAAKLQILSRAGMRRK